MPSTDAKARLLERFKRVLDAHDALAEAYRERTGLELTRESDYTPGDLKRASRILRSGGKVDALDSLVHDFPKQSLADSGE